MLDEATARMDPLTEARVVAASERLLAGRTGVLVAHRLSTIERAGLLAVLDHGRVVQQGERAALARVAGPYRDLLAASVAEETGTGVVGAHPGAGEALLDDDGARDVSPVLARRAVPATPTARLRTGRRSRSEAADGVARRRSSRTPATGPASLAGCCTRCSCAPRGASSAPCCSS